MTIRSPGYLDERFIFLQDEMLKKECEVNLYDCDIIKYKKHFALTNRDITDLKIDAICCETLDYLGSMTPNLRCMDNRILLKGGLKIREDCNKINSENNFITRIGFAFEVSGYNLPATSVIKIILPRVDNIISHDIEKIKMGIISALDIMRSKDIKRFAINLSVDKMFNIPQEMYINIVINTISSYIKENRYKVNCVLVVDNDEDEVLVKNMLKIRHTY